MRVKFISFLFLGLLFASICSAGPTLKNPSILLNYPQLIDLSTHQRSLYLRLVRKTLEEMEQNQQKKETHYAFLQIFDFAQADAIESCVYAGWIGHFEMSGNRRVCIPPKEAQGSCPTGEIACNPRLFGQDVCVDRGASATQTCNIRGKPVTDVAKIYYKDGTLEKGWNDFKLALEAACTNNEQQSGPCSILKSKFAAFHKENLAFPAPLLVDTEYTRRFNTKQQHEQVFRSTTSARVLSNEEFARAEQESSYRFSGLAPLAGQGGPLCKNRDQGSYGTCSAFCTLCTLDDLSANLTFRTSANWISLYVAAENMCASDKPISPGASLKELLAGGSQKDNLRMAMAYGFCDEEHYIPYSSNEPPGSRAPSSPTFRSQFGLDAKAARDLFCPLDSVTGKRFINTNESTYDYRQRLDHLKADPNVDNRFIQCAYDSLENLDKLGGSHISCKEDEKLLSENPKERVSQIKEVCAAHGPMAVSVLYPNSKANDLHCMTIEDYNDSNNTFEINNSWGGRGQQPLQYYGDKRDPFELTYLNCTRSSSPSQNLPRSGVK